MKIPLKHVFLAAACLAASLAQAAPPIPLGQLQLRVTYRPCDAPGVGQVGNSMYNCRFADGSVYAPQINNYCWGRFPRGTSIPSATATDRQTRMVSPIPGTTYLLASGGTLAPYTRYDFDGTNPVDANLPDGQLSESFDWVDNDTIICTYYNPTSANRRQLYLVDVTADPFALAKNTTWNANGYITSAATTRIRNVRVGQMYTGYAYYGDNGVADNPKVYALNLATGAETELGSWNGTLKSPTSIPPSATSSWGLWTAVERGGYLYLQSSDDGIQVYSMTGPTTMGAMVASYTPEQVVAVTGGDPVPYYGFDVAADDAGMVLGDNRGNVYELQRRVPVASGQWNLRTALQLHTDLGLAASSTYNPRFSEGDIYAVQINVYGFARYPAGSPTASLLVPEDTRQTRTVLSFRGVNSTTYMLASGATLNPYTRYDWDGSNPQDAAFPDGQLSESFDWVDDDTIICTDYTSGSRKRLYLLDVTVDPFALTKNTTWNANGYVENSAVTRIRNVRVGQTDPNYAYYGDNGVPDNPKVYAINLTTGVSTELGHWNGVLKDATTSRASSFGLWTVVERGGYLYLQSSDDGIQVFRMASPTTMDPTPYTAYSLAELNSVTGDTDRAIYGFDVSANAQEMVLGSYTGKVYELESGLRASIARWGTDIVLSWPAYHLGVVIESSTTLDPASFADLPTQPAVVTVGGVKSATIPADSSVPVFYRLRK